MILMLRDGDNASFFVLSNDYGNGRHSYSLCPWRAEGILDVEADGGAIPDVVVHAVTRGVPIPRDGSLFGWRRGDPITALVAVYTSYRPASPEPGWTVMPLAGIPEAQWPPFAGERLFGHWFWEYYRGGNIVSLDDLIAGTPDTVFWVDTKAILGSDSCAVARDIKSPEGHTLRAGCYVSYQALRTGKPVPPLGVMLAEVGKNDLAPRFRRAVHRYDWAQREGETTNTGHVA